MTNILKYDVVIVKFPFASSIKYKARPAVIISSDTYNTNKRDTLLIMAISSSHENKLDFEIDVENWKDAGLLNLDYAIESWKIAFMLVLWVFAKNLRLTRRLIDDSL